MAQVDWGRINKRTRIICRELGEHVMCHCRFQKKLWCCMECPGEKNRRKLVVKYEQWKQVLGAKPMEGNADLSP